MFCLSVYPLQESLSSVWLPNLLCACCWLEVCSGVIIWLAWASIVGQDQSPHLGEGFARMFVVGVRKGGRSVLTMVRESSRCPLHDGAPGHLD